MTHRLDDGGVRRRGARDGGDDARRGGRHHNLYARENTRARARVVSHAFAFAFAFARPRARPAPAESSSRRVVTHRVLSIHIRHPMPSDPWMHRARARPMLPSSIARSRARISSNVLLARRLVSSSRVVSSPPRRRRRATVVRGRRPRPRASPRVPRDERTHERRTTTTTIERSIERARPAGHYFSPRIHRARDASLASPRAPSRHPSTHPLARAIGPTLARIESNRDRAHLLFLGRLRGARDDDASGASSGVRGRVDRARLARVRDRSSRREHRRCLPPSRARRAATGPRRSRS